MGENDTVLEGRFILGATASEQVDASSGIDGTSKLTVITTPTLLDADINEVYPNMANLKIFSNITTSAFDGIHSVAIPAKSLETPHNTIPGYQVWSILYVGVIPVLVIAFGLVFWSRRRNR